MDRSINAAVARTGLRGFFVLAALVVITSQGATQNNAVPANSAEARARVQAYLDRIQGQSVRRPDAKTAADKAQQVQAYRDSVIAAGAVVRYISQKEAWPKGEWEYVRVYVNAGPANAKALSKGLDQAKLAQLVAREEVQGWIEAEATYQKHK